METKVERKREKGERIRKRGGVRGGLNLEGFFDLVVCK